MVNPRSLPLMRWMFSTCWISRSTDSPFVIANALEWSVIAMKT
jgi:hypothetical protein